MPEVGNLNLYEPVWRCNPVDLSHDRAKLRKARPYMFENMLEKYIFKSVVIKGPWRLLDIHQDIRLTLWEVVSIHKSISSVESASEVQLGH